MWITSNLEWKQEFKLNWFERFYYFKEMHHERWIWLEDEKKNQNCFLPERDDLTFCWKEKFKENQSTGRRQKWFHSRYIYHQISFWYFCEIKNYFLCRLTIIESNF